MKLSTNGEYGATVPESIQFNMVLMFEGPRPNRNGVESVGDTHLDTRQIHISLKGFEYEPGLTTVRVTNSLAGITQSFRRELAHALNPV
jgi:hypothetical protein